MNQKTSEQRHNSSSSLLAMAEDYARQDPTKAVVSAASAGFLINLLPIGAIISGLVAACLTLARPVLLCLGLLKAFEFVNSKPTNNP